MPLNNEKLQERAEWTELKLNILNVASQLSEDSMYTKEKTIEDLIKIVDQMEK